MADPKRSRGFRNRNPGNIEFNTANQWQGQTGIEAPPPGGGRARFAVFSSHEYGIRALAMLLTTYQDRHGLRTVAGIIGRWAPGNENNTGAYVRAVAQAMGIRPDDTIDVHQFEGLRPLVVAIITHECGGNPYDAGTIDRGLALAGVTRPVTGIVSAARTERGRGALQAAGMSGGAGLAGAVLPALGGLQGLDWRVAALLIVVASIGGVLWILSRRASSRSGEAKA